MKTITALTPDEEMTLREAIKNCDTARVRQRSQDVLWSSMDYSRTEFGKLLFVIPDVVSSWLSRWTTIGLAGLYDEPRSGRPPIYSEPEIQKLRELVDLAPQELKKAQAELAAITGKHASRDTLKRVLKKN